MLIINQRSLTTKDGGKEGRKGEKLSYGQLLDHHNLLTADNSTTRPALADARPTFTDHQA
jgi:hypothetical protein